VNDPTAAPGNADVVRHDAFISYSKADKLRADAVCSLLERTGIRCWIAPRDVMPGETWGGSIVRAIKSSRVMILVFSSNSNQSSQVLSEVERAVNHSIPIIPFRIEPTEPTGDMEFFIGSRHWLDALDPPLERHIERLAKVVKRLLPDIGREREEAMAPSPPTPAPPVATVPPLVTPPAAKPPSPAGKKGERIPLWRNPLAVAPAILGGIFVLALVIVVIILIVKSNGVCGLHEAAASVVPPGDRQVMSGNLGPGDAVRDNGSWCDSWSIDASAGERLTVTMEASFDAYLTVVSPSGSRVSNDDSDGTNARVNVTVEEEGRWFAHATTYREGASGSYTLTVDRAVSAASGLVTPSGGRQVRTGVLGVGDSSRADGSYVDNWLVVPSLGGRMIVTMESTDFDAYLTVTAPSGAIYSNDDGGGGTNARVEVTANEVGAWHIMANTLRAGQSGSYTLTIEGASF
jgi:hypothetical protein